MKNKIFYLLFLLIIVSCKKESSGSGNIIEFLDYTNMEIDNYFVNKEYKIIIINFWASFCSPCKEEMVSLTKIYDEYKDKKVLVIGVSIDDNSNKNLLLKICEKLKINYPILYGVKSNYRGEDIIAIPKTYILDNNLNIIQKFEGKRGYNYFKNVIKNLLNE